MSLHDWFGRHVAELQDSHWEAGHFVSRCTQCGRAMIKLPGQAQSAEHNPADAQRRRGYAKSRAVPASLRPKGRQD